VGRETLVYEIDSPDVETRPSVLCLHGNGPTDKATTKYLGERLAQAGLSTVRIDFSGQGESSGVLLESSLEKRRDEALSLARWLKMEPLSIIGTSMGGYVAATLLDALDVASLVLFCPAAYSRRARTMTFQDEFLEETRRAGSYLDSDVPQLLGSFAGRALVVFGTKDEVIPAAVRELYRTSWKSASSLRWLDLPGCPHPIHGWLAGRQDERQRVADEVAAFLAAPSPSRG
jgi:pimeloyl-ACP methyl ester carboxylesterase